MFENDLPAEDGQTASGRYPSRIKRPVPTTDEPTTSPRDAWNAMDTSSIGSPREAFLAGAAWASRSLPTREQIAEVLYQESGDWKLHRIPWSTVLNMTDPVIRDGYFRRADATLALFQNGADRG